MDKTAVYEIKLLNEMLGIVFSLSYENPLDYLTLINEELLKLRFSGSIYFDLLLSNGQTSNRYIFARVKDGCVVLNSLSVKKQVPLEITKESAKFYLKSLNILQNGILSEDEILSFKREKLRSYSIPI
jgi:hypothetical protein